MKKIEFVLGLIAIIGVSLKLLNISGGAFLIVITFSALSIFYYLSFAFFNNIKFKEIFKSSAYKDTNAKKIIGAVVLGLSLSAIIMGILFKLQFWSGGSNQLEVGLVALGIISVITIIFYYRNKINYYKMIFIRIGVIGGLGLIVYLIPSDTLVDIYYGDKPAYAELYKRVLADPYNKELNEELYQMSQKNLRNQLRNSK
jgi:hypothetical protein